MKLSKFKKGIAAASTAVAVTAGSAMAQMPAATAISDIDPSTYVTAAVTVVGAVLAGLIGIKLIKKFANRST